MPTTSLAALSSQPASSITAAEQEGGKKWYDVAPVELVANTWKFAIEADGVHHLRLEAIYLGSGHQRTTELRARPTSNPAASTWRHRLNISRADQIADYEFTKWAKKTTEDGAMWLAPFYRKKNNKTDERIYDDKAKIHGKNDLVVMTFDESCQHLSCVSQPADETAIRRQFHGLSRVAMNWDQKVGDKDSIECFCSGGMHRHLPHCPHELAFLVRLFAPVRHFYFILRIGSKDINEAQGEPETGAPGTQDVVSAQEAPAQKKQRTQAFGSQHRVTKKKPVKRSAEEVLVKALEGFRKLARANKLEIWSDSEREYYEIQAGSLCQLKNFDGVMGVINETKQLYRAKDAYRFSDHAKKMFAKTRFHVLVTRKQLPRKAATTRSDSRR